MSSRNEFASEDAKELHNIMYQCEQLRATAKLSIGIVSESVTSTLSEAAVTIEKLAFKPIDASYGSNYMGDVHQRAKNWLLSEFKKDSVGELSFLKRAASTTLLDALCHLTKTHPKSLFNNNNDWVALLQLHRSNQMVITFMLHHNINPNNVAFSEEEKKTIMWHLVLLSRYLYTGGHQTFCRL
jgi:hypothetical protein